MAWSMVLRELNARRRLYEVVPFSDPKGEWERTGGVRRNARHARL